VSGPPPDPGGDDRIAELERRVAALEATAASAASARAAVPHDGRQAGTTDGADEYAERFWALEGLRERLPDGDEGAGAVLFTGVVRTPTGETYRWQEGHTGEDLLDRSWEEAGSAFEALASPARMLLLREVLHGRATAAELAELPEFGTSGQVYHHLRRLTGAGWLRTAARGRYVVPAERIVPLLAAIAAVQR
jgi:DNA-binding transcriptional ArsR family regulator